MKNTCIFGSFTTAKTIGVWSVVMLASLPSAFAQLIYQGGGTGQIEFSGQPVFNYGGLSPLWGADNLTGGNDILVSPGGTFNGINYVNPNLSGTGVVPLGNGINWTAAPGNDNGIAFGGGSMILTPTAVAYSVIETAAGQVSVGIGAESSTFKVGALGVGATIGTYLSLNGLLNVNSAVAASLVTYIDDITTGTSVTIAEVLAATYLGGANTKFVALYGQTGALASGGNAWVQFGGGGTTYTGFASSSVPNFLGVGDTVTITSVLTEAADPDATINAGALPSNLNGATLPSTLLFDTVAVPEPGVLAFFAMGLPTLLFLKKRRSL